MAEPPDCPYLVWVDIETFGLDEGKDPILELGIRLTDFELNTVADRSWLCWEEGHDERFRQVTVGEDESSKFICDLHTKNSLFSEAIRKGLLLEDASLEASFFLEHWNAKNQPMAGSSVQMDRSFIMHQMPILGKSFHYRNIDVSTVKELCRRYNPAVYNKLPKMETDHRVHTCLDGTIEEFRFYTEEFLLW